jgi:hypothetical protein
VTPRGRHYECRFHSHAFTVGEGLPVPEQPLGEGAPEVVEADPAEIGLVERLRDGSGMSSRLAPGYSAGLGSGPLPQGWWRDPRGTRWNGDGSACCWRLRPRNSLLERFPQVVHAEPMALAEYLFTLSALLSPLQFPFVLQGLLDRLAEDGND